MNRLHLNKKCFETTNCPATFFEVQSAVKVQAIHVLYPGVMGTRTLLNTGTFLN